jgi:glutamine synthetase
VLPKLPRDAGDRNRTSPFAFTGNKFEFRAVSSNQSIAYPNIALNVAVTESLDYMATELEKAVASGKPLKAAVADLLPKVVKDNKRIIFNGNGYSKEWEKEAGKRGLLNLKGHKSIGGLRASIYNAMPLAGVQSLVAHMREFAARHG